MTATGVKAQWAPGKHDASTLGEQKVRLEADVAIIGAGAGGCAAAAALAERGLRVVMVEEGRHWEPKDFKQDVPWVFKHMYQERGARSMRGNTVTPLPGGRGVGGSTLINSAICFRCPDPVLQGWHDEHGVHSVTVERFAAYYDRIWKTIGVSVQSLEFQRLNNIVFKMGAEALGLDAHFMPRNAPGCVGCGVCQLGCPSGGKASVDRTFLAEALATGNVGVYASCRMERAFARGSRIEAVTGSILDPETQQVVGEVEVRAGTFLLSGGPIGSPVFLQANRLSESSHCGAHLVVHPTAPGLARFPFEIKPWRGVTQGCYVDCWDQGYLLQTYSVTPDQYFAILPTALGEETMAWMADLRHLGSAGAIVHDEDSEGHVTATPVGVDISYFLGDGDRRKLIEGMRTVGEVFFAAGATAYLPGRVAGGPIWRREDIEKGLPFDMPAHYLHTYASHPMGTCRMAGQEKDGVVDPVGRVYGWDNLRVADASVFPTSLGVNPQVTVMAIGLMVGEEIAKERA